MIWSPRVQQTSLLTNQRIYKNVFDRNRRLLNWRAHNLLKGIRFHCQRKCFAIEANFYLGMHFTGILKDGTQNMFRSKTNRWENALCAMTNFHTFFLHNKKKKYVYDCILISLQILSFLSIIYRVSQQLAGPSQAGGGWGGYSSHSF